jgi:outer membrane protein TolC
MRSGPFRLVLTAAVGFALVRPPALGAQDPLTLAQAVALAQERGPDARAARAARDAARHRHRAFAAGLLPQLSFTGAVPYNRAIVPVLQDDGTTRFVAQQQTSAEANVTLAQKLPFTGGDLFVSSTLEQVTIGGPQALETWSSTPVAVGLRQDILRPNRVAWDRRERNARAEVEEREYREALQDVALSVTEAFFDVYAARVALANAATNAAVNDTLYRLNTGRFEVGRIGENDLLQSELALVRARTALEGARLTLERATAALRLVLGLPADAPVHIVMTAAVPDVAADTARAVAEALQLGSAGPAAALQEIQARRRLTEARLGTGPGATLQASFGFNATAPAMRLVYDDLLEARRFSVSVQMPLLRWGVGREGVRAAEAERDRAAALAQASLAQAAHEARFAALELEQARRNVALLAKADTVAGKRFEVAYNRYVIGRIAIDNLYLAQAEKDQALVQFVQGLRAYWRAYYGLRRSTLFDFETGQPIR